MLLQREIRRVAALLLISFFVVGIAAAWWAVTGPTGILQRGDNARRLIEAQSVARGALLDRDGVPLATSERVGAAYQRVFTPVADSSVLGRVEAGVGVSGPEAAFDAQLRGEPVDPAQQAVRDLLHQARPGADVRLTLSAEVQEGLQAAMGGRAGAAVVISLADGEILGLWSQPGAGAEATPEPGSRANDSLALTGQYPIGSALLPGNLSAALLQGVDITETRFPAGECAVRLPEDLVISLQEALLFSCPRPFAMLGSSMPTEALQTTLSAFVVRPPGTALDGLLLVREPATEPSPALASPLELALMAAAIANDGAAPMPQIGLAWRAPGAADWLPLTDALPGLPVTTATTARRLQDLMRQAVAEGAAQNAGRPRLDIGGLASVGGTDDAPVSWFTGFTSLPNRQGAAVAIVLDGVRDPGLAADIGGQALEVAAAVLQAES
jgi:cell division protein FtsI/penicillin-binding protein 2